MKDVIIINEFEKKQLLEAERMFKYYNGSYFFMGRDEVYGKYSRFNISKEQEQIWLQEKFNDLYKNLGTLDSSGYYQMYQCAEKLQDISNSFINELIKIPCTRTLEDNYVDTLHMITYALYFFEIKKKKLHSYELKDIEESYNCWMKKFLEDIIRAIQNDEFKFDSYYFRDLETIQDFLNKKKKELHEIVN